MAKTLSHTARPGAHTRTPGADRGAPAVDDRREPGGRRCAPIRSGSAGALQSRRGRQAVSKLQSRRGRVELWRVNS